MLGAPGGGDERLNVSSPPKGGEIETRLEL